MAGQHPSLDYVGLNVVDAMEPHPDQIADDTTIDQAGDLLDNPGIGYLLVHDAAGRCEGLVTRSRLHVFMARSCTPGTPSSATPPTSVAPSLGRT